MEGDVVNGSAQRGQQGPISPGKEAAHSEQTGLLPLESPHSMHCWGSSISAMARAADRSRPVNPGEASFCGGCGKASGMGLILIRRSWRASGIIMPLQSN